MTQKPSLVAVRAQVRTCETWELLLLAGGLQHAEFGGGPPQEAIARLKTMQAEVVVELERRGIAVAPNPELAAHVTYRGEVSGQSEDT